MNKITEKKPDAQATTSPKEITRRFVLGFIVSAAGMIVAAVIYFVVGHELVFDMAARVFVAAFVGVGILVGWWMIRTGEKYTGYGVLFGSVFGIILAILGAILIALFLVAQPVTGI